MSPTPMSPIRSLTTPNPMTPSRRKHRIRTHSA